MSRNALNCAAQNGHFFEYLLAHRSERCQLIQSDIVQDMDVLILFRPFIKCQTQETLRIPLLVQLSMVISTLSGCFMKHGRKVIQWAAKNGILHTEQVLHENRGDGCTRDEMNGTDEKTEFP